MKKQNQDLQKYLIIVVNFNPEEPKHPVYRGMYKSETNAEKEGMKNSATLSSEIKQKSDKKVEKSNFICTDRKKSIR